MKIFNNKRKKYKYINGTKGIISLFLVVIMTPFLSIAAMLVETGRFNSCISLLDEMMGISSNSTLANYDDFMQDRFGLLSVSQKEDLNKLYGNYLNTNAEMLGNSLSLNNVSAEGKYSLNDNEVLKNQLLEYGKFNVPTELAVEFLDLKELIAMLEEATKLDKMAELFTSKTKELDSTITLVESAEELKKSAEKLEGLIAKYQTDFTDLDDAVKELAEAKKAIKKYNDKMDRLTEKLEDALAKDPVDEDKVESIEEKIEDLEDEDVPDSGDISRLEQTVNKAKEDYATSIETLAVEMTTYKGLMDKCSDALKDIQKARVDSITKSLQIASEKDGKEAEKKQLGDRMKEMDKTSAEYQTAAEQSAALDKEIADLKTELGYINASGSGAKGVEDGWNKALDTYSDATWGECITGLEALKDKVNSYDASQVTESDTAGLSASEYHNVTIAGYVSKDEVDKYLEDQENELKEGSLGALIDGLTAFMDSIFKTESFYNPELSSYINTQYYNEKIGGLPGADESGGGVLKIITSIGDICKSVSDFGENLVKLKLLSMLKSLKDLIVSIGELIISIIEFAADIVKNLLDLFSTGRIFYTTYNTFNLPCRTDYEKGKTMTGYKFSSIGLPDHGLSRYSIMDNFSVVVEQIKAFANGTGTDYCFSGAELEYLLFGSNSEVANQLYTFVALYFLRFLVDVVQIQSNAEVQALAASSTFGYPIVMGLILFIEPLADTILLVNGKEVSMVKSTVYLTPTGLPKLISALASIANFDGAQKEAMEKNMLDAFNSTKEDYDKAKEENAQSGIKEPSGHIEEIFKLSYKEHTFLLMLLTVTNEQQIARLKNIIQMECTNRYHDEFVFDLDKSYTYITTDVKVNMKQFAPSLAKESLFKINRKQYRGY